MINARPADLITEAERYLAAVEVYRAEGCAPHWRPESRAIEPNAGVLAAVLTVPIKGETSCN